jgi:hypothetical protein
MAEVNFESLTSMLGGIKKLLKLQNTGVASNIPTPLILVGAPKRPGLSSTKIASRIINRKSEAGLPIGNLPSGQVSPDEIMIRIIVEEIIRGFQEDAVVQVAIPMGTTITAAGSSPSGPVSVVGSTITMTKGYGVIQ